MMRRLCILAILAFAVSARPALGCSCKPPGPVCQAYWKTDAVLDATVVDIQPLPPDPANPMLSDTLVKLDVQRSWKGGSTGPLEVTTSRYEGSCGYPFKKGIRYLVFARQGSGVHLQVSLCSATQEYDGSGPAAEFFRTLAVPGRGGRIFGTVQSSAWATRDVPVVSRVRLSGAGREQSLESLHGRYEFSGVAPGRYVVEPAVPDGYTTYQPARDVEIPDTHACAEENFIFAAAGRILGMLVDHNGRPVRQMRVELVPADAPLERDPDVSSASAYSNNDGSFEFLQLPPGRYVLGINLRDLPSARFVRYPRTMYLASGSSPQVLALDLAQTLDLGTWQLPPPLEVVELRGVILWSDGTPAAGVSISVWDRTGNPGGQARGAGGATSDAEGRFVIPVLRGRTYTFGARDERVPRSALFSVTAPRVEIGDSVPETVRIVIRTPQQQ